VKKYEPLREAEATYFGHPPSSHCAAQSTTGQSSAEPSGVSLVVHLFKQLPLENTLDFYFQVMFLQSTVYLYLMTI